MQKKMQKKMHKDLNSFQMTSGAAQNLPSERHSIPSRIVLLLGQLMVSPTLVGGETLVPMDPGGVGSVSVGQTPIVTKGTLPEARTGCSSTLRMSTMKQKRLVTLI